jgi:hypothetical protein
MATTLESTITRTFKQLGLGYDVVPGTTGVISVSLDGQVIYNGPVPGVPDPVPDPVLELVESGSSVNLALVPSDPHQELFTWPLDIDDMGPMEMKIEVWDCTLQLGATMSNYTSPVVGEHSEFNRIAYEQTVNGLECQDPFTNVRLNGTPIQRNTSPPGAPAILLPGQCWWVITEGCIFEATLNVEPGWL